MWFQIFCCFKECCSNIFACFYDCFFSFSLLFTFTFVVGLYYCFSNLSDARIFIIMYGVTSMYFSAVMVRNECLQSQRTFPPLALRVFFVPLHGRFSIDAVQGLPSERLRGCVVKLLTVVDPSQECMGHSYILIVGPTFLGFITLVLGKGTLSLVGEIDPRRVPSPLFLVS